MSFEVRMTKETLRPKKLKSFTDEIEFLHLLPDVIMFTKEDLAT